MKNKLLFLAFLLTLCLNGYSQATAYDVPDINQCNSEVFDLTVQTPITLGNQPTDNFTVTYFLSWQDAENNANPITNPTAFMITTGNIEQALFIRVTNTTDGSFDITSFVIGMWGGPQLPEVQDIMVCESFTLPALEIGNYYTGPGGVGAILPAGTVIVDTQTIFIYVENGVCSNGSSFVVTIGNLGDLFLEPVFSCSIGDTGYGVFNLEPTIASAWQSVSGAQNVTVYETYQDAVSGTNAIANINEYMTNVAWAQTILYVSIQTTTCNEIAELLLMVSECTDNTLSGHVAFDADGNGCTESDADASGILVYYVSGNYTNYAYTDTDGNYTFNNVPNGPVSVYVNTFYPSNTVATPNSHILTFNESDIANINFCLTLPAPVNDVSLYMTPITAAQPGFTAQYAIVLSNYGNTVANGTVTLQFNDTQLDFITSSLPMTQTGNTLTLSYTNLQPYQYQVVYVEFLVALPGIVDLGDVITFTANATFTGGTDSNPGNNTHVLDQIAVNSWDPNDINVREGEQITEVQADGYLHYTIRFQNMGTANAHNVKILTTLDDNLDWNTFQPLIASHDFQANRSGNGNDVEFRFNNIELPGEQVNEPESHGFVTYKIKPKASVTVGDSMSGQAGIYFDFNPAINTNQITTTVMNTAGIGDINANGFVMYPNPASTKVTLQMSDGTAGSFDVTVTDVLGKTVVKAILQGIQGDLDVSSLKSGVYFITLNTNGKQATKKLVIE